MCKQLVETMSSQPSSSSPKKGGIPRDGNEEPPALPPLKNLPPNKRMKLLPETLAANNAINFTEGDWRQKIHLENQNTNGLFSAMAGASMMQPNNFQSVEAAALASLLKGNNNSALTSGAESKNERNQMEGELRRMKEENEKLIQMLQLQQLGQQRGGDGANNMGNLGAVQPGSIGTAAGLGSSVAASATSGMHMNAAAMMGGMMGMNNSMNIMPYSTMLGGMSDMTNLNNIMSYSSSLANPSLAGGSSVNNSNNIDLPASKSSASSANEESNGVEESEEPNWEFRYRELVAYKAEFGHTRVPARWKANPKLGRWVMTQRRQFTVLMQGLPSALTTGRIQKLNDIGFVWALRADPITMWNRKFLELKAYKKLFGNCNVPQRYQTNPKLGTWVHTQRRQYKLMLEGKKTAMNEEKIAALDSIGFFWVAKPNGAGESDVDAAAEPPSLND